MGPPPYAAALANLGAGGPPPPPPAAAQGVGLGAPPKFEGALPPPTGMGQMPLGAPGTSAKSSADEAILALRAAQAFFPSLGPQVSGLIDALKSAAQQAQAKPTVALGTPSKLGSSPPPANPIPLSGSPGE